MGIQINGATDSITAIDGTIDVVSAIGNAGVVTATAFVGNITGNVTGNINNSTLLLQTGGTERLRINSNGDILTSGNSQLFGSNTSDGSDNKSIMINGGGSGSDTRGGYLLVHGNEHSSKPGITQLHAGNVGSAYIAFNTGGNERLRITSTGNVGIKSTAPRGKLDIQFDGAPSFITFGADADNPKVEFFRNTGGSPSHYATEFQQVLGDFVISTAASANLGSHSYAEKLRITSAGKVGINRDNPDALLHIHNSGTSVLPLKVYRNDVGDVPIVHFQGYNNAIGVVDKFVVTTRGRVGVNTDNPQRELHVKPSDNNSATAVPGYIRIEGNGSDQAAILELYHTRGNGSDKWPSSIHTIDAGLTFRVATGNNGSPQEKVRIDSSGRLRVASTTESADGAFDDVIVGNYSGNRGISILSGSSSQGALGFAKNGTMADGYVAYNHNSTATNSSMILKSQGKIQFNAGSTEKLRIDADGHVTVTDGSLIAQNSGAGSGTSQLQLQPYGTQGYINHTGSSHLYLRMGSSFAQRFIFRNDGDLEISDGNLRVASGHGIDFSATADSGGTKENELLDDYEEGTFTPTFYYVSGTSNVSYTTQEGRYTKIGRLVSISIKMSISNIGSGNNNMRVGGLPFAPVNSGVSYDYFNFSAVVGMNIGSGRVPFAQLEDYGGGGRVTMYSYDYSSSSNYSEINSSHLSNGLNFGMTGTYVTS